MRNNIHYYCDNCGDETDKLYRLDNEELCERCILDKLEVIE